MKSTDTFISFMMGMVVMGIIMLLITVFMDPQLKGYKQGQIDALTGKIKYTLVTNPDSTREWKDINK